MQRRKPLKGAHKHHKILWVCGAAGDPSSQPLQVRRSLQLLCKAASEQRIVQELIYGVQPSLDLLKREQWHLNPAGQGARAHGRLCLAQELHKSSPAGAVADVSEDLKVAQGDGVQDHELGARVDPDLADVAEKIEVMAVKVGEHRSAGSGREGPLIQPLALRPSGPKPLLQSPFGICLGEACRLQDPAGCAVPLQIKGSNALCRPEPGQLRSQPLFWDLCGQKLACRDIQEGKPNPAAFFDHSCQEVV
ncbi:MAG: hypothetical protein A4E48_02511 [Methanosaeta sp. PtaU1.Bin060]|nr:MAG: hypothetical protein A4E48_02511 [Methanosaeta sp. PtaU1.Bin060]